VSTKTKRVDGGWSVTGQKVWTSDAVNCQRGLATVRTDANAQKHKGITAMIIDLADPGVEIRPLKEITGEALFNEVFFADVFVPDRDVVGAVNAGWTVAMATLGNERVSIGGGSVTLAAEELLDLLARHRDGDAEPAAGGAGGFRYRAGHRREHREVVPGRTRPAGRGIGAADRGSGDSHRRRARGGARLLVSAAA